MQGMRRRGIVATRAFRLEDRRAARLLRRPLRRRLRWRQLTAAGQTQSGPQSDPHSDHRDARNHKKIAPEHLLSIILRMLLRRCNSLRDAVDGLLLVVAA